MNKQGFGLYFARVLSVLLVALMLAMLVPKPVDAATITNTNPKNGYVLKGVYNCIVTDAGGATRCELSVDGNLIAYMSGASPNWNYSLDTRGWQDGVHLLTFKSIGGGSGDSLVTISVKFDNKPPEISVISIIYPFGQSAAKFNDTVIITSAIADATTEISSVKCDATELGNGIFNMSDDGKHDDGSADDGVYGSDDIRVNVSDGYYNVKITAIDGKGNAALKNKTVPVDDISPSVSNVRVIYPLGQSAAKQGDLVRVIADVTDKYNRIPVDVVLTLDNSGSMAGQPIQDLVDAATTFISYLIEEDRLAVYCFGNGGGPGTEPRLLLDWTVMDASGKSTAVSEINTLLGDTGHNTPIWDTIYDSIKKADSEHMVSHNPVVIGMTDGGNNVDNYGVVEPASPWPPYDNDGDPSDDWITPPTVGGLCEAPLSVYTIGLNGVSYTPQTGNKLREIAESSNDPGTYYFAPTSGELDQIYREIAGAIVTTGPYGLTQVSCNATGIGNTVFEPMYDDGLHADGSANDGIYGSEPLTVSVSIPSPALKTLGVSAYDIARNVDTCDAQVVLDGTPPSISGMQVIYTSGASVSDGGTVKFIVSCSDGTGAGISSVTLNLTSIGGSSNQPTYVGTTGYETPYVTVSTGNSTGVFTVWATAKDKAGNTAMQSTDVRVDNTHLSVAISSPASIPSGYQYVSGMFVFRATASDPGAVDQAFVTVFGTTVPMSFNSQTGYFEYTTDTTTVGDGNYTISATFYDVLGKKIDTTAVGFRVDNNPPALTVNAPKNGAYIEGVSFSLNVTVNDTFPGTVEYNIDRNGWLNASIPVNTSSYPDGPHSFEIRATDLAGHVTLDGFTVYFDNSIPAATLSSPVPGSAVSGHHLFRVTASDGTGISGVSVLLESDNLNMLLNPSTGYYEFLLDTSAYPDGVYNTTVTVSDMMFPVPHQKVFGPFAIIVDNSIPALTFNYPRDMSYVGLETNLTLNITAADSFISTFEYDVDGCGWVDMGTSLNTTSISEGMHALTIKATDLAGHVTEKTITIIIDKFPPVCSPVSPSPGEFISGLYEIKVAASDYNDIGSVAYVLRNVTGNCTVVTGNLSFDTGSGYYTCTIDTASLPDEIYELVTTATDRSGKTTTITPLFFIDNNAPSVFVTNPKNMGFVEGIFDFTGNISYSDRFIGRVVYEIDGLGETAASVPWDTKATPDGLHDLVISAYDGSGKKTVKALKVYVDNTAPGCEVSSPVYVPPYKSPLFETVSGVYTFRVHATDAVGIKSVNLSVFGSVIVLKYNPAAGYYEYTLDTAALPGAEDGENIAVAEALDLSGKNTTSVAVHFNLDNNPPVVSMASPVNGARISGETEIRLDISGETFPVSAWYELDSNGWQQLKTVPPYTTINSNKSKLSDGVHVLSVKVIDMAKHETVVSIEIIVQNNAPELVISTPNENQYIDGIYLFQVAAIDPVGITSVTGVLESETGGYAANLSFTYNPLTGYFENELDTRTLTDGGYLLTVHAKNSVWECVRQVSFRVDNTHPALAVNEPREGDYVSGTYRISVTASDTYLSTVEYNIDGNSWTEQSGKTVYNITWDTTVVLDGTHTINIRATDGAGHLSEDSVLVYVDNTPVSIIIESPAKEEHIRGIYQFRVMAEDAMGVKNVMLKLVKGKTTLLSDGLVKNQATQFYEYTLNTSGVSDGKVEVRIAAFDHANHVSNSTINITVDNSAPQVTIQSPKSGSYYGGIEFKAQVKDSLSGVGKVELYIDSARAWVEMLSTNTSIYKYTWFTDLKDNGVHTFGIKATDSLGNSVIVSSSVTVGNIQEKDYLGMILRALPLMMFIFAILLIILLLVLVKKGTLQKWVRGDKPTTPKGGAEGKNQDEPDASQPAKEGSGGKDGKESELISSVRKAKVSPDADEKPPTGGNSEKGSGTGTDGSSAGKSGVEKPKDNGTADKK
jgi:hypothetical protein